LADTVISATNPGAGSVLQSHHATLSDLWTRYWKNQGGDTSRSSSYWAGTFTLDVLGSLVGGEAGDVDAADSAVSAADGADSAAAADRAAAADSSAANAPRGCSFTPSTRVLMDHGKTKPIGKIKPGDKVEAADPATGRHEGPRQVTHTWINHDNDLIDLTIQTSPHHTEVIHTTSKHPFWDDTLHTWIPAGHLKPGHNLETATNHHAHILTIRTRPGTADMYNLTVQQLHTYYVEAGNTPVLVHNSGTPVRRLSS
jgi:Pretoxin HINT domain